jgi:lysophospholipase L1-like esterase
VNSGQRFTQWLAEGRTILSMTIKALSGNPLAWEPDIQKFEAADRLQPPSKMPGAFPGPADVIVFTGSSSITFWSTLPQDMAPLPVINRGFGGSRLDAVVHYAPRTVVAYRPRAVVLFAGTNDIAGPKPKSAQQVFDGYRAFVDVVHAALPATPIYYISITPTPSRWKLWPIVQAANRLIADHTQTDPRLHFIDLTDVIFGADGQPDRSLFRLDRLHPNPKGYAVWTARIKPILLADLN